MNKIIITLIFALSTNAFSNVSQKKLIKMADSINQTLPRMIDAETRLDNMSSNAYNSITYKYTLTTIETSKLSIPKARSFMQDKMEKHFCTNSKSLTRDFGVNIKNKYFDTESRYLFETNVDKELCKKYY